MADLEIVPFSPIGDRGSTPYPDWIRALRKSNGVYLIRERRSGDVVYVGESHSDRLYATLTRHFQHWSDKYQTAGPTYTRRKVDVALVITPQAHAIYLQNMLICMLTPRDNAMDCEKIKEAFKDDPLPDGWNYNIQAVIDSIFWVEDTNDPVPF